MWFKRVEYKIQFLTAGPNAKRLRGSQGRECLIKEIHQKRCFQVIESACDEEGRILTSKLVLILVTILICVGMYK